MQMTRLLTIAGLLATLGGASAARAADRYVSPAGKAEAAGTQAAPWDLGSALDGRQKVAPGDTVWIAAGTYRFPATVGGMGFPIRLAGTAKAPITVRSRAGERVTIDGGLTVQEPSTHLCIRDLEITVTDPRPPGKVAPDPTYHTVNRPWGGLNVYAGQGCIYRGLVIHDNCQGISFWAGATDSEVADCILYDNGWDATDRGHGHAIYTQNQTGVKTIANCIFTGGYGYSVHAYGSKNAYVDNYLVRDNLLYNCGTLLIGGGRPSHGIRSLRNVLFHTPMQIGYSAPENDDCEIRDNVLVGSAINIVKFRKIVNEGNRILSQPGEVRESDRASWKLSVLDSNRANLAILNLDRKPAVAIDAGSFLKPGDRYRFMDPRQFYGSPVLSGVYRGGTIEVPVSGEFAAFVVFRER